MTNPYKGKNPGVNSRAETDRSQPLQNSAQLEAKNMGSDGGGEVHGSWGG